MTLTAAAVKVNANSITHSVKTRSVRLCGCTTSSPEAICERDQWSDAVYFSQRSTSGLERSSESSWISQVLSEPTPSIPIAYHTQATTCATPMIASMILHTLPITIMRSDT